MKINTLNTTLKELKWEKGKYKSYDFIFSKLMIAYKNNEDK